MGETAGRLKLMIIPILQIGDGMLGEEVRRGALMGDLPGRCLGTVLAKFEHARMERAKQLLDGHDVELGNSTAKSRRLTVKSSFRLSVC